MRKKDELKALKEKIRQLETEIENVEKRDKVKKKAKNKESEKSKGKKGFISEKIQYRWKSPVRVFKKRDRAWFLKIAAVALVFILYYAFVQELIVIIVICVIVLIAFLLGSVPPNLADHSISNKGIRSMERLYKWEDLEEFWVSEKMDQLIVYVKTNIKFPTRLEMLVSKKDERKVVSLLGTKLDYTEYKEKQGLLPKLFDGKMINPSKYESLFDD